MTQIVTRQVDGITIVEVPRHIMLASSHGPVYTELREVTAELIANGHKKIVFNLSQSEVICPGGIGELIRGFRSARDCGGELKLSNVQPKVRQVLQITHLLTIFDIHEDETDAVRSFGAA
jgi:anti-sigma B factor antagonist